MSEARLKKEYTETIVPQLMKEFDIKNRLAVPCIEKVVLNMGVGDGAEDIKVLAGAAKELEQITGQKPLMTRARQSIAGFKIRKNQSVGCKVTLRGKRMFEFLDRFMNFTLPRIRDFRGVPAQSFDQNGNYSVGIREQTVFPEIDHDKVRRTQGMDITVVTNSGSIERSKRLLELFGMPFTKNK
jgi:large subunit ribosomal protein L5